MSSPLTMNFRNVKIPAILFALAGIAPAATWIYEPFDYATSGFTNGDGASLGDGNQTGGLGLEGQWNSLVNNVEMEVRDEAMTFTDGGGNILPTEGLSIRRSARSGYTNHSRTLSAVTTTALTADNSTMWMSFLYEDEGFSGPDSSLVLASESQALANNHSLSAAGFGVGITIGEGGANSVEAAFYNNSVTPTRVESGFSPDGPNENTTFLLAAKVNWNPDGTPDEIFVFNITDITTEPSEGSALASNSFDFTLAQQQSLDTLNIGETQIDAFDEIRFGTSFADVVATNPIPEPGALALLSLSGFAFLRRRRS